MKKFVCLIISLILILSITACTNNGKITKQTDIYNSMKDYSGIQGYKNWYYLVAKDDLDKTEYMIYDDDMCSWRTKDVNCLIEYHIVHPGQLLQVIKAWKAPCDGEIEIASKLQRRPVLITGSGSDGCYAFIALNDDKVVFDKVYTASDVDMHDINSKLTIKKDEMVYFVINCSGNYTFDQTYWNITINFTYNK